jgi:hypothetical protein
MEEREYQGHVYRRNAPTEPWQIVGPAQQQPQTPSFVPGGKQIDPAEQARLGMAQQDQQRQNTLAPYQIMSAKANATNAESQQYNTRNSHGDKLRDDYNQDASVKAFTRALPPYMASLKGDSSPASDLALTYAFATMMDPQSSVREGEQQMQSTGDTIYGQTVARLKKELGDGGSFRPEYRAQLLRQMRGRGAELRHVYDSVRRDFEGRAQRSGINPADILPADPAAQFGNAELDFWAKNGDQGAAAELQKRSGGAGDNGGPGPDEFVHFAGESKPVTGYRFTPEQDAQLAQAIRDGDQGQAAALLQRFSGNPAPLSKEQMDSIGKSIEAAKHGGAITLDYSGVDKSAQQQSDFERYGDNLPEALKAREGMGADALGRGLADTGSFGFADELAAGATTLFSGGTMKDNLQKERAIDEADNRVNFKSRLAGQIGGGLLNPIGRGATTAGQAARAGGVGGALYGFGSGNSLGDRTQNALLVGAGGAAGGYAVSKVANALASGVGRVVNSPGRVAAREARSAEIAQAGNVARAAEAEGVPVSRGILDPDARNKVTALETTPGGGNTIHEGMTRTAQGIETGVRGLGQGGRALTQEEAGTTIQGAGNRFIEGTGKRADRMYQRARDLAGDAKVSPAQAITELDTQIAKLSETPGTNEPLINYLNKLKGDLSRKGGLSIEGLRSLRTNMRGQIDERNLTSTPAEGIVTGVLSKAADDITAGLSSKPGASQAFRVADKFYAERMTYIDDVVRNILGNNRNPLSAEKAFGRLAAMTRNNGDARRLAEIMRSASPGESRDIAATFAKALGREKGGDFSPSTFVSQVGDLSSSARRILFGKEGAQSIENLQSIAKEWRATANNLNKSRTGVTRNYRNWLGNALGLVGGAAGYMQAGAGGAALGAMAVKTGADASQRLVDRLSAKALMSPEITKWLASAPPTTSPAAINAHIKRLGGIAARNPQLAAEVSSIEQMVMGAIRQLPQGAAAQGQRPTASNPNAGQNQ